MVNILLLRVKITYPQIYLDDKNRLRPCSQKLQDELFLY